MKCAREGITRLLTQSMGQNLPSPRTGAPLTASPEIEHLGFILQLQFQVRNDVSTNQQNRKRNQGSACTLSACSQGNFCQYPDFILCVGQQEKLSSPPEEPGKHSKRSKKTDISSCLCHSASFPLPSSSVLLPTLPFGNLRFEDPSDTDSQTVFRCERCNEGRAVKSVRAEQ